MGWLYVVWLEGGSWDRFCRFRRVARSLCYVLAMSRSAVISESYSGGQISVEMLDGLAELVGAPIATGTELERLLEQGSTCC